MERSLRIFAHHFLHPKRLILLLGNTVAVLLFCIATWSLKGSDSPIGGQAFLGIFDGNPHPFLIFVAVVSLWIHFEILTKHHRTRPCFYSVPVSKFHWLKWNTLFAAVALGFGVVLFLLGSKAGTAPILFAGCTTVVSLVARCIQFPPSVSPRMTMWLAIGILAIFAFQIEALMGLATNYPVAAGIIGLALTLSLPFFGASADYRQWRLRFPIENNMPTALAPDRSAAAGKRGQPGDFSRSATSPGQISRNLLAPLFPMLSWTRFAIGKILIWRIFFGTVIALLAALLHLNIFGGEDFENAVNTLRNVFSNTLSEKAGSFLVVLVLFFTVPFLFANRGLLGEFQALGRRELARGLEIFCWRLALLVSIPLTAALAFHDIIFSRILEAPIPLWSGAMFWPFFLLYSTALFLVAIAVGMKKKVRPQAEARDFWVGVIVLVAVQGAVIWFLRIWEKAILPRCADGASSGEVAGIFGVLGIGLVGLLILSFVLVRGYLHWYFKNRPLA